MRPKTTQQDTPAIKAAVSQANKLVGVQVLLTALLAVVWGVFDKSIILSVLYGGGSCLLPNLYLARRFFRRMHDATPKRIVAAFYIGEMLKMLVSVLILFVAIRYFHAVVLPLLAGYLIASSGFWFAPVLIANRRYQEAVKT